MVATIVPMFFAHLMLACIVCQRQHICGPYLTPRPSHGYVIGIKQFNVIGEYIESP